MFALRGIAISFSIFFILYSALSLAAIPLWRSLSRYAQGFSPRSHADALFLLRMFPLAASILLTAIFAVPSFLRLEPRSVQEDLGFLPIVLACGGLGLLVMGAWNAVLALRRTARTIAVWSAQADAVDVGALDVGALNAGALNAAALDDVRRVPVFKTSAAAPPLTASGILRPGVWFTGAAEFLLTKNELDCALRHEFVHVRRRDNLRKLFLRMVPFPGMAQLDQVWRDATEMAADEAAVSSASQALDLAAAVIKLSHISSPRPPGELTAALVSSPAGSLEARVQRLLAWSETPPIPSPRFSSLAWLCCSGVSAIALAVSYSDLLLRVHAATEWMVR
jgi:hypothetical protein